MTGWRVCGVVGVVLLGYLTAAAADDPKESAKPADPVVLVDSAGAEVKLSGVKWTAGTRRLAWLADPKGTPDDAKKGPLALEVREPHSTTYQKGITTLIPVASVGSVRYEADPPQLTVAVKGLAAPVTGTLQYRGINVIGLEGVRGGKAEKFSGSVPKGGFKSATFPGARVPPARPEGGVAWSVQIDQPKAGNPWLTVKNLKALHAFPGGTEQLTDTLPARKGGPEPVVLGPALKKLEFVAVDPNTQTAVVEVTTGTTADRLVAVPLTLEKDGRTGTLVGLVGEVECGWKLFPLHCVKVLKPDEKK